MKNIILFIFLIPLVAFSQQTIHINGGGGGGGTPYGLMNMIQFEKDGAFYGDSLFTRDSTGKTYIGFITNLYDSCQYYESISYKSELDRGAGKITYRFGKYNGKPTTQISCIDSISTMNFYSINPDDDTSVIYGNYVGTGLITDAINFDGSWQVMYDSRADTQRAKIGISGIGYVPYEFGSDTAGAYQAYLNENRHSRAISMNNGYEAYHTYYRNESWGQVSSYWSGNTDELNLVHSKDSLGDVWNNGISMSSDSSEGLNISVVGQVGADIIFSKIQLKKDSQIVINDSWKLPKSKSALAGSTIVSTDALGNTSWQTSSTTPLDSVTIYALTPTAGTQYYCTDCSGNSITGRIVAYIGGAWRRLLFE